MLEMVRNGQKRWANCQIMHLGPCRSWENAGRGPCSRIGKGFVEQPETCWATVVSRWLSGKVVPAMRTPDM